MASFTDANDPSAYISLVYKAKPTPKYVENALMDATIMLLADRVIAPNNVPKAIPRELMKTVKQSLRPMVLKNMPRDLDLAIKIQTPAYDSLFKAAKLVEDKKHISIVTLDVWPLFGEQGCRYTKSAQDMYEKEVNKFLTACQVLSTKHSIMNPVYRMPPIKANFDAFFIRANFKESASVPGRLYIEVPQFVEEVAAKYCPEALCTLSKDNIEADSRKVEVPDAW